MNSLLLMGFLIGMRHAMEADHVAAVATLVSRRQPLVSTLLQGGAWGLGHTITLSIFGSAVLLMDRVISAQLAQTLELAVGVMLVLLGADVMRRLWRDKIHFHGHTHVESSHFHAHSHAGESLARHAQSDHSHEHPSPFPLRALVVGLMHGMAGSAAVILLAVNAVVTPWEGALYILLFGIGSMSGMALLSLVIALPLRMTASRLTWAHNGLQGILGGLTIVLGGFMIFENGNLLAI